MIDLKQFNLVYFRKADGRKFLVWKQNKIDTILVDTETGEVLRMSETKMRMYYRPDKKMNKVNKKKRPFMNYGKKRIA
jgi:hypothetical protein